MMDVAERGPAVKSDRIDSCKAKDEGTQDAVRATLEPADA